MKTYTITCDEENGYHMLLEDGIGMAKSKSRNALRRIRDALTVENALIGLTVKLIDLQESSRKIQTHTWGVVLAVSEDTLVVRLSDDHLDRWTISACQIVDPDQIDKETHASDPPNIGILAAVKLLERFLSRNRDSVGDLYDLAEDVKKFLAAREAAQPAW